MFRRFDAKKDTYITNKIISGQRQTGSNVGAAGTLDLFKIYGQYQSGSTYLTELSRLLVQFDIESLKNDFTSNKIDITDPSFQCLLELKDVYGGQSNPSEFNLRVHPLARSWNEGKGLDVIYFQDYSTANFTTASLTTGVFSPWFASGANASGSVGTSNIDVYDTLNFGTSSFDMFVDQYFDEGTEDLLVDVTNIMSATLTNQIADNGFRISFHPNEELDSQTRFVKRFGSRQSIDPSIRPKLIVKYDDSEENDRTDFRFDVPGTIFLKNQTRGNSMNLLSGTSLSELTGSNCLLLNLELSGVYSQSISASQRIINGVLQTGEYYCSFILPASGNPVLLNKINVSGSLVFQERWTSIDKTIVFASSSIEIKRQDAFSSEKRPKRYVVSVPGVSPEYEYGEVERFRVFIQDFSKPYVKSLRVSQKSKTVILNSYYSVRDAQNNKLIIPFDNIKNSTKLSSDGEFLFFDLYTDALIPGGSYVIDIMIEDGSESEIIRDASSIFRIIKR